jgi:hypothetical protein
MSFGRQCHGASCRAESARGEAGAALADDDACSVGRDAVALVERVGGRSDSGGRDGSPVLANERCKRFMNADAVARHSCLGHSSTFDAAVQRLATDGGLTVSKLRDPRSCSRFKPLFKSNAFDGSNPG